MKVIKFADYIQFQLRRVTKQLINMHNVFLCSLGRINSALEALRNALYKCSTYLLTY